MSFAEKAKDQDRPPPLKLVPSGPNDFTPLSFSQSHKERSRKKPKEEVPESLAWFEHKYALVLRRYEKIIAEGKQAEAENFLKLMKWEINLRFQNVPQVGRQFQMNHPNF